MSLSTTSMLNAKAARTSHDWKTVGVIASAICLLLLSTPGVRVVEASDEVVESESGQTCEAGFPDLRVGNRLEIELGKLRRNLGIRRQCFVKSNVPIEQVWPSIGEIQPNAAVEILKRQLDRQFHIAASHFDCSHCTRVVPPVGERFVPARHDRIKHFNIFFF